MAKLCYQGHASFRLTSDSDFVIYVDPYAGKGYDKPADLILITHEHSDHNAISLVNRKPTCCIITEKNALANGEYHRFNFGGVEIEAVAASNDNHDIKESVGYIITIDGVSIYAAGDTSTTEQMNDFAARKLDYALLPADGIFNMGLSEASKCAKLIGADRTIPIHIKPGALFDRELAEQFNAPGRLILDPETEIILVSCPHHGNSHAHPKQK